MNLLPEAHLQAIGRVAVMHSRLDLTLTAFVGRLLGTSDDAALVLGRIVSMRNKCDLAEILFSQRCSEKAKQQQLESVLGRAQKAADKRNSLMHAAAWGGVQESPGGPYVPAIFQASRRHKDAGKFSGSRMTAEDVNAIADKLQDAERALGDFMRAYFPA